MAAPTDTLTVTHRSTVTPDQIDHLGHMNVRFYGVNARAGSEAFLAAAGAPADDLVIDDVHTHHLAEQMEGASLAVRSGAVDVADDHVWLFHELVNTDIDVVAATFHHRVRYPDGVPAEVRAGIGEQIVSVPAHGKPRSLDLSVRPDEWAPSLDALLERGCAIRKPRVLGEEECAGGTVPTAQHAELIWGGEPIDGRAWTGFDIGPNGERLGWAVLESRVTSIRAPRAGDRIQSFSALRAMGNKTSNRMQWVYDLDSGDVVVAFEVVDILLDLDARKAAVIPDSIRNSERNEFYPELFGG